MAQAVRKKIVVCGGNGFLGSRICKAAVSRGWDVVSLSRSGEPTWSSVTASSTPPSWSSSVQWRKADILRPTTYVTALQGADAVVHSLGILLEADYKGVLQGKEPLWAGLQRAFSPTKHGSQNPLQQKDGSDAEPLEEDGQITYELMNRDSAILLAREASAAKVPTFAYISAAVGTLILPSRYIDSKRAAESTIQSAFPATRSLFFRPGLLYDSSRSITVALAGVTGVGALANSLVGGRLTPLIGAGGIKPLKADVVADAVVEGIHEDGLRGPIEVLKIEELASKAWRRGML